MSLIRIKNSTHVLRKVECNEILGIDSFEDIVEYYNGLTAPNDYKDGDISATIEELKVSIYWKDQNI